MIVKQMLEKPYKLGSFDNAFDCLSFIIRLYEDVGIKMPDEWRGWTRDNYAERWTKGDGRKELYDFFHSLGAEVEDVNYMIEGDLMLLNVGGGNDIEITPSVYLGNANVLIVTIETGVVVIPLWAVKEKIYEVRRLG